MPAMQIPSSLDSAPILGQPWSVLGWAWLDLNRERADLKAARPDNPSALQQYIQSQIGSAIGVGGYLELRSIYQYSSHFSSDNRCQHLGVDIWTDAYQPIFAPLAGKVHSFQNNDNFRDYGPTIILQHELGDLTFFSLYGHLQLSDLTYLEEGQLIEKGQAFCHLGDVSENGGWPPHLHFQLMTDMRGKKGDFPGVCAPEEVAFYKEICPNPNLLLQVPEA